jgi:hypothetical protein
MRYRVRSLQNIIVEGLEESYLDADLKLFRLLFSKTVAKRLFDAIDKRLVPKILEDISYILERKWAENIPRGVSGRGFLAPLKGFYHCHFLGESDLAVSGRRVDLESDLERIVSPLNVSILYHTREFIGEEYKKPEHNILSSLTSKPRMIDPEQFLEKDDAIGFVDLGKNHYAQIYFSIKERWQCITQTILHVKPRYGLENGVELHMEGVLLAGLLSKETLRIESYYRHKYLKDKREAARARAIQLDDWVFEDR